MDFDILGSTYSSTWGGGYSLMTFVMADVGNGDLQCQKRILCNRFYIIHVRDCLLDKANSNKCLNKGSQSKKGFVNLVLVPQNVIIIMHTNKHLKKESPHLYEGP